MKFAAQLRQDAFMVQVEPRCVAICTKFMDACAEAKVFFNRHFPNPPLALLVGMHVVEFGALQWMTRLTRDTHLLQDVDFDF